MCIFVKTAVRAFSEGIAIVVGIVGTRSRKWEWIFLHILSDLLQDDSCGSLLIHFKRGISQ